MLSNTSPSIRAYLNKVPAVTLFFWIVKVLCTTVGETAADFLSENLHLGLTNTTYLMGSLLAIVLVFQFKGRRYVAGVYWLAVVLLSIVGTLITDNLTDQFHISLVTTTILFSVALGMTFIAWHASEKTLSVQSIDNPRREAFYWLAILFTFALGTAAGDLVAEKFGLGYLMTLGLVCSIIIVLAVCHFQAGLNSVFTFWSVYVLTRPFGASLGDLLSQPIKEGGLGLGTVVTSGLFLAAILGLVSYLAVSKRDIIASKSPVRVS